MDLNPYRVLAGADPNLIARYIAYHRKHPEVWDLFLKYADEMRANGRTKYSAWAIVSRIRWDHDIKKTEEFKISNGYIALYARMLVAVKPRFQGFFQFRPFKAKHKAKDFKDWVK